MLPKLILIFDIGGSGTNSNFWYWETFFNFSKYYVDRTYSFSIKSIFYERINSRDEFFEVILFLYQVQVMVPHK